MIACRYQAKPIPRAIEPKNRRATRLVARLLALLPCCFGVASLDAAESALRVLKVFEKAGENVRPVMHQQAPGPAINRNGDVAYGASRVRDEGVWLIRQGEQPVCLASSDQLPGLSDVPQSANWQAVSLNDSGSLAFVASVRLPSQYNHGVWCYRPTFGVALVALSGQPAIGIDDRKFEHFRNVFACKAGEIGFFAMVRPPDADAPISSDPRNDSGFWIWRDGELQLVGPAGQGSESAVMNDSGSVVCSIEYPRYTEARVYRSGTERVALRRFQRLEYPGHKSLTITASKAFGMNNADQISFYGSARSTDGQKQSFSNVLATLDAGATTATLLLADGMEVDGKPVEELNPNQVTLLNARGDFAAFERHYISPKYFNAICFAPHGEPLRTIARSDGLAPGVDAVFSMPASVHAAGGQHIFGQGEYQYPGSSSVFSRLVLNARGQLAFTAQLGGNVTKKNNYGLWATQTDGHNLRLIARTGDTIQVGDDDVRTIKHISFAGPSGNEDARPSGMNDEGQIAFAVAFTDDSFGVIVSDAVAGDAGIADVEALRGELAEKPAINPSAAAAALADWEQAAAIRLKEAKQEFHDSDNERLTRLAKSLREEYEKLLAEAIAWQVEKPRTIDTTEHDPAQQARSLRLQHLPQIWRGLAEWPYPEHQETTTASKRKFDIATNLLLGKYGQVDAVSDRVTSVQEQLKQYASTSLIREGGVEGFLPPPQRLFRRNPQGKKLKQFAEPIGRELPEAIQPQPESFPSEGVVDGPLVQFRTHIRALLKLTVRADGRLELDREHWKKPTVKLNAAQLTAAVEQLLSDSGFDDHRIGRLPAMFRAAVAGDTESSAFIGHFDSLRAAAVAAGSGGGGGGGRSNDEFDLTLRSDPLAGYARGTPNTLELELSENTLHKRELTVATKGDSQLEIKLESRDQLMRFTQKEDGTVRLLAGPIEDLKKFSADSFAALLKKHEKEVRRTFLQPLQTFGVLTP